MEWIIKYHYTQHHWCNVCWLIHEVDQYAQLYTVDFWGGVCMYVCVLEDWFKLVGSW